MIELPIHEVVLHPGRPNDLSPIDLAQDGHRQAMVIGLPPGAPIDGFLERTPTLAVLLGWYPFGLERLQPQIQAVHCDRALDESVIRCLPGLKAVSFSRAETGAIDLEWFSPSLEHLGGDDQHYKDFGAVTRFSGLQSLRLDAYDARSWRVVAGLTTLRRIRLGGLAIRSGAALERLVNVEEAELPNLGTKDLDALRGWTRLRKLHTSAPRSLDGIAALTTLEDLRFEGGVCPPLAPLTGLPCLQALELRCSRGPVDLDSLARLTSLRSLTIPDGDFSFPSAAVFQAMSRLEVLDLRFQRILDGKVSQFGALKNLRTLWLGWEYSPDEVARLREALPGCDLHVEVGTPPESAAPRRRGFVEYDRDGEDETWSIFQDLCGDLDTDDNHEAERLVKAVLKQQAPAVARRILFDSERDAFCAVARTEADLLLVADLIVALAGARQSFL